VTDQGAKPPLDFPELESEGGGPSADEFAHVPTPRRRHPVVSLAAAGLALFLVYQVHDDLFYALSHATVRDLGDARALVSKPVAELPINQYVRVSGMADRESGVTIDTAGSWSFTQFFRVLGTGSRLFVSRVPDPIPVEQAERDVFVGRLVRFKDLSFQAAIRKHFADRVTATHFFAPKAVRDAVAVSRGGPVVLTDMLGEKVSLSANDELSIDTARPSDVQVDMPRAKYADAAAARAAVEAQGAQVLDEAPQPTDNKTVAVVVTFAADKRDHAMSAIADLDERVHFRPVRARHRVRVADLAAGEDHLSFKSGGQGLDKPVDQILAIRTLANVQIPDDALLLREGDRPGDHLKTVVIATILLAFAAINLLALRARA
jgi:hypothetical protein